MLTYADERQHFRLESAYVSVRRRPNNVFRLAHEHGKEGSFRGVASANPALQGRENSAMSVGWAVDTALSGSPSKPPALPEVP